MAFGVCTNCFEQISGLYKSKMENLQNCNDEICYVKHVLAPLCVFFRLMDNKSAIPSLCLFPGFQGGRGTTCLCNFPATATQKWKFPKLIFFIFLLSNMIKYPM